MTLDPAWGRGSGLSPPEPMPIGAGKSLRDPGFVGSGLGGRQITKNPLNMLGGMGSNSNGVYTNGSSSSFDQGVRSPGYPGDRINGGGGSAGGDRMRAVGTGSGVGNISMGGLDRMSGGGDRMMQSSGDRIMSGGDRMMPGANDRIGSLASDRMGPMAGDRMGPMAGDRMGSIAGDRMGPSASDRMGSGIGGMMNKMGGGGGYGGMDAGYGMQRQQRSPPSSRYNGFSVGDRSMANGNIGGPDRSPLDRNPMTSNMDRDMMPPFANQNMRDMMGGGRDRDRDMMMEQRGGGFRDYGDHPMRAGPDHRPADQRLLRDYQLQQEMRERDMHQFRVNNSTGGGGGMHHHRDIVRSNSEMGPERNLAMLDRGMMGMRDDRSSRDMMAPRDYMRSNSEMMGMRDNRMSGMGGGGGGMGRDRMDMMGAGRDRMDMMGGSRDRMMDMSYPRPGNDNMMGQRSMSMNNGSYGGGHGMDNNGYNRSMSFNGPPSPHGNTDMKIGTWNDSGAASNINNGANGANNPSVSTFEIGTFNINDPGNASSRNSFNSMGTFGGTGTSNGTTQSNNGPFQPGMGIRETGIIEKLLHSYGFIQCCDRQARLFFHFSQFEGNIEHLKIGDPVEFEMTYDRRTGKPIASVVSKIAPEVVMSEERVIGTVTTEVKISAEGGNETQGRISYENRGECFFLPFNTTDVEGNVTLTSGDRVSFQMATVQRSGSLAAKTIRLENPAAPVKYRGVVNSLQEAFGFIERADVVKEIYFNIIDMQDNVKEDNSGIQLGDDVEFIIQTRSGKEVACNLVKLPQGTVVFEDIGTEWFRGQVLKPLDRSGKYQQTEPLPGKVKYRAADRSEAEIPFGDKDQLGDFTLKHGDWVKFIVATDRRDKLKRATKIELLDESFSVSDERREQGVVQVLQQTEACGQIKCVDRSDKMFFYFSECLDVSRSLTIGDEVEFTSANDPKQLSRNLATRIKHLTSGTVKFDIIIAHSILGVIAEEPTPHPNLQRSPSHSSIVSGGENGVKEGAGRIVYELNHLQLSIPVYAADCDQRSTPRLGDKVQFNINQLKATKETNAVNVRVLERANIELPSNNNSTESIPPPASPSTPPPQQQSPQQSPTLQMSPQQQQQQQPELGDSPQPKEKKERVLGTAQRGFVAALKDGFGFIETLQHDKEIFFHFSHVEGKAEKLEVGLEVEYYVYSREKGGKVSAEGVKLLPKNSIPKPMVKEEMLYGKVVRPLRSVNPDQADYCGLIVSKSEEGKVIGEYQFGIASLLNKKELLQEGDPVNFQVSVNEPFAYNIKSNKQKLRSTVEAVKGQFGFLSYEQEEGKKLFFHMSEVEGGEVLQVGDQVEFVVVTNSRTKKHSACCVRKLGASQRPERLISKLKALSQEESNRAGPKLVVTRQPRGPDGTKGFANRSVVEEPAMIDLMEQLTAQ